MDYRRLQTFRTVSALGSFSRAALALHCSQSTVSTQVRILEEELETPLFDRQGSRITLTRAGETYLAYANRILSIHEEARERLRDVPRPLVTLALRMPQSLSEHYLPGILHRFHALHPQVGLDVSVCAFAELQAELRTGVTDVAFLLAEGITTADLQAEHLADVRLAFVASPGFEPAQKRDFGLHDLAGCTLFLPKHDCGYRMQLRQEMLELGIRPRAIVECNGMGMLKRCLSKGLGIALLPEFSVRDEMERGELVQVPHPSLPLETGILMIRHKGRWISEELDALLRLCREEMAGSA